MLKADYIHTKYGFDCFADDTGLEVEALGGEPGVFSARYAGENHNSYNNMNKVLSLLGNSTNRKACFRTVIALIREQEIKYFEGKIDGTIAMEPRGESGFGYDPIFIPEGYSVSFAQLSAEEKNKISHRALAIKKLVKYLNR
jgi:XTP/dITP diphosphohydrolase